MEGDVYAQCENSHSRLGMQVNWASFPESEQGVGKWFCGGMTTARHLKIWTKQPPIPSSISLTL
jgi:hypothetical protein